MTSLASIPALRALPPRTLTAVARDSRVVRPDAGTVIRPPGEPARGVLLLLAGTVVATYHTAGGTEVWPARWEGPAILDKAEVLYGGAPSTGLAAVTPVVGRLLPRMGFLRLLRQEESVRVRVLEKLAGDLVTDRQRLAQAVTMPAVARVAAWLAADAAAGRPTWRGSQEDLARVLGLSRVTVNRALSRLARAGAVRVTRFGIVVLDPDRLGAFRG